MIDYMYIISNDQGFIKVGISKNPTKRIRQLQTGNEHVLTLLHTEEFECSRNHLLKIEKLVHNHFNVNCLSHRGEWYEISPDQLEKIKNFIIYSRIRYENDQGYFCFK